MSAADKFCLIRVVPVSELLSVWIRVKPTIERILALAVDAPWVTPDAVYKSLAAEKSFLLLCDGHDGEYGVVVSFSALPTYKVGRISFAFGRGMRKEDAEVFHAWMKQQGCKYVEASVRTESRQRLFNRFGYRYEYTMLRKDLS